MILLYLTLTLTQPSEARMWTSFKNLCAKYLGAEDPWPFAEYGNQDLIDYYRLTREIKAGEEIKFRVAKGMLEPRLVAEFYYLWEGE